MGGFAGEWCVGSVSQQVKISDFESYSVVCLAMSLFYPTCHQPNPSIDL